MIRCGHPDRHQNNDRTPSVGIHVATNMVKCFGCGTKPISPLDLVMDVLGLSVRQAADWIAERFPVPTIPARKHLVDSSRCVSRVGLVSMERPAADSQLSRVTL